MRGPRGGVRGGVVSGSPRRRESGERSGGAHHVVARRAAGGPRDSGGWGSRGGPLPRLDSRRTSRRSARRCRASPLDLLAHVEADPVAGLGRERPAQPRHSEAACTTLSRSTRSAKTGAGTTAAGSGSGSRRPMRGDDVLALLRPRSVAPARTLAARWPPTGCATPRHRGGQPRASGGAASRTRQHGGQPEHEKDHETGRGEHGPGRHGPVDGMGTDPRRLFRGRPWGSGELVRFPRVENLSASPLTEAQDVTGRG